MVREQQIMTLSCLECVFNFKYGMFSELFSLMFANSSLLTHDYFVIQAFIFLFAIVFL